MHPSLLHAAAVQQDITNKLCYLFVHFFGQCVLMKLSYLLSKSKLSTEQVRSMVGTPLCSKLTCAAHAAPTKSHASH
jgi:hypothetical protein